MKNIHVLPTDKPSRLHFWNRKLKLEQVFLISKMNRQHIYITNDEEIKDGDWFISIKDNKFIDKALYHELDIINQYLNDYKKIILTTDQDLIKDGVQAIDDEFLEWFVKNPSCEFVRVEKYHGINTSVAEINAISGDGSLNWQGKSDLRDYEIIIPKEKPKQETLEEVIGIKAHEYSMQYVGTDKYTVSMLAIQFGYQLAQQQNKNLYNEEDMIKASEYGYNFHKTTQFPEQEFNDSCVRNTKQWLTVFKKK